VHKPGSTLVHLLKGQAIEKVSLKGLELSLVASWDGTEVIHHRLSAGFHWAIGPEEGWKALELLWVISGRLTWKASDGEAYSIGPGESLTGAPVEEDCIFFAETDTEFLYVTSQPVFHQYSKIVQELTKLTLSVEEKDGYTADHCQRIKQLSMLLGEKLRLTTSQMYALNLGAFFHDLGKIKIPENILGKPESLTKEEWTIMKKHTVYGGDLLNQTKLPSLIAAAPIVIQHHERFNGSGYPYGLKGEQITIGAAIVAVVDSFDAMTTDRIYKKGRSRGEALEEIKKESGILYHPDIVNAFISVFDQIDS
jgi:HD-GYP domain-containing protein (c-di-GMP phosphodiesterase class II)